ncbi:MAG: regulatory iron-sulfur-containing complex subunit RicT [Desulfobacteraceae bacterium]|nr:regulatory iron-sulfur-containing complex subunit RicT [Desulfobacteraceae bacterium]
MTEAERIEEQAPEPAPAPEPCKCYRIQFREQGQVCSALTTLRDLKPGEAVMVQTEHGLEPALVSGAGAWHLPAAGKGGQEGGPCQIIRRASADEIGKYERLIEREKEAFHFCRQLIEKHQLIMKLIRVERFFNGSKIIFYFTAENRVDFRNLVKDLVQEFRTRVEMRQVGVRHETKLIGGLGCCGRELCCASHIRNFAPVSIKMAKEQDVPLNPSKISGICNRLLCCLTYEYQAYHQIKKHMPKVGKTIRIGDKVLKVIGCNTLEETLTVLDPDNPQEPRVLGRNEWEGAKPQPKPSSANPKK